MDEIRTPYDTHAEQAVLGSVILDRDAIGLCSTFLQADDFYHEAHRWIYQAAIDCHKRGTPADYVTIATILQDRDQLEPIGGLSHLIELTAVTPTAYHVEWYGNIVLDKAQARLMIEAGRDIAAMGYESDERDSLMERARLMLERVERRAQSSDIHWAREISNDYINSLSDTTPRGLPTGLVDIDRMLVGGLHKSSLILLAARTGMRKTWFALQVALNVARSGRPVVFLSLEMNRAALWQRLCALQSGMSYTLVQEHYKMNAAEVARHMQADGELSMMPLGIMDRDVTTVSQLRQNALGAVSEHGQPALVIIDYLNLLTPENDKRNSNRVNDVGEISRACKQLASSLNIPVLALAQLSRAIEQRQDGIPRLSDLRESGSLEQDADVVLFLDRPDLRKQNDALAGTTDVIIGKHRQGPVGTVTISVNESSGRLGNHIGYEAPAGYGGPQR